MFMNNKIPESKSLHLGLVKYNYILQVISLLRSYVISYDSIIMCA